MKTQKVSAAFPSHFNRSGRFMDSLFALQAQSKYLNGIIPLPSTIIASARNDIVRYFLDETSNDWLWFVDTDMVFEPDILDRMVEAADPKHRPILGALCFTLDGTKAVPTIFVTRGDGQVGRVMEYPKGKKLRAMTGTGCLLIHRTALEKMRAATNEDGTLRWPKPWEWFTYGTAGDKPMGEDIAFCRRASQLDIPVYVDTSIKCGHEKPVVIDEEFYENQRTLGIRELPSLMLPTFVVIAAKNRHGMTNKLISQLDKDARVLLYDNGSKPPFFAATAADGWPLHRMWNAGLDQAEKLAREQGAERWNVAILNNDLEVEPGFLAQLEFGIRGNEDNWISYPNHHGLDIPKGKAAVLQNDSYAGQTMSGWAFMLKGETGLRFDERFEFWYGDTDLQKQVEAAGKNVVCVGGCHAHHLEPNASTFNDPDRLTQAKQDELRFAEKWGYDPATLYFGSQS